MAFAAMHNITSKFEKDVIMVAIPLELLGYFCYAVRVYISTSSMKSIVYMPN